jgi:hypothetical protein
MRDMSRNQEMLAKFMRSACQSFLHETNSVPPPPCNWSPRACPPSHKTQHAVLILHNIYIRDVNWRSHHFGMWLRVVFSQITRRHIPENHIFLVTDEISSILQNGIYCWNCCSTLWRKKYKKFKTVPLVGFGFSFITDEHMSGFVEPHIH